MRKSKFLNFYTAVIYLFLFMPMLYLVLLSFNTSKNTGSIEGFTLEWYEELFSSGDLIKLLGNSVLLAVCASVISTILGTMAAIGIFLLHFFSVLSVIFLKPMLLWVLAPFL